MINAPFDNADWIVPIALVSLFALSFAGAVTRGCW